MRLNRLQITYLPPSFPHLQIGIVSTVQNRLSKNRCKIEEIEDVSRKSKVASRHEDGKNMSPQKISN